MISNQNDINSFMEEEEVLTENDPDAEMEEEEETLSLLIDSRLLHKDFIVDKFRLALLNFRKVREREKREREYY